MEFSKLFIQLFSRQAFIEGSTRRHLIAALTVISMLVVTGSVNAAVVQYTDYSDFLSTTITSDVGRGICTSGNFTTNAGCSGTNAGSEVGANTPNPTPMTFSGFSAFEIGMTFGNDENSIFDVTLSIFDNATLLDSVLVTTNGNDISDQFIGLVSDLAFNSVSLAYGTGSGTLAHFITRIDIGYDDVSVVPVPAAVWLFGTALIGFFGYSRRRKIN